MILRIGFTGLATIGLLSLCQTASAADLKAEISVAFRPVIEAARQPFLRSSGHSLTVDYGTVQAVIKESLDNAPDIVIAPAAAIDTLIKEDKVASQAVTSIARSGIALAVAQGAVQPDISSPDALKQALLHAKSLLR